MKRKISFLILISLFLKLYSQKATLVIQGTTESNWDIIVEESKKVISAWILPISASKSSADGKFLLEFSFPVSANVNGLYVTPGEQSFNIYFSKSHKKREGMISVIIPDQSSVKLQPKKYKVEGEIVISLLEKDSSFKESKNPMLDAYPFGKITWDNTKRAFIYSAFEPKNQQKTDTATLVIKGSTQSFREIRVLYGKKNISTTKSSYDGKFILEFKIGIKNTPYINISTKTVEYIIVFSNRFKVKGQDVVDGPPNKDITIPIDNYVPSIEFAKLKNKKFIVEGKIIMPYGFSLDPDSWRDDGYVYWDSNKQTFVYSKRSNNQQQDDSFPFGKKYSITGNFYADEKNTPLENAKVNLVNKKGAVVQTTTTNVFGSYLFTNLIQGENYIIAVVSVPPKITIKKTVMKSRDGKTIAVSEGGKMFKYELLASDKNIIFQLYVDDSKLLVDIKGKLFSDKEKQMPLANAKIILKNAKGEKVGVIVTNGKGFFQFVNLPADQNYTLMLDEKDASLLSKEVFLANTNGRVLKTIKSKDGKFFHYEFLPSDQNGLSTIYYDDPWLKAVSLQGKQKQDSLTIIENIYYDFEKWELQPVAINFLDKVVEAMKQNPNVSIELISHTDSRGTNEFNMELSQKRASFAVDYVISKGIDRNRISGKGMGEAQLVNHCKDDVDCTEEEHAQNRRTEFRIKNISK